MIQRYFLPLFFWLILGTTFFASSLFFAHFRQTRAFTDQSPSVVSSPRHHWRAAFDPRFPGSSTYVAMRVHDRVQAVVLRPEEMPVVYLERAEQRLDAAKFAWEQGDTQQAVTTLYKAHGYLHRAAHTCQEFEGLCEVLQPRVEASSQNLRQVTLELRSESSDDITRNSLAHLSQQFVW